MAEREQQARATILKAFKSKLDTDWRCTACRFHSANSEGCVRANGEIGGGDTHCCTKSFYNTAGIVCWMRLKTGQSEQTNAVALLNAALDSIRHMRNEPGRPKAGGLDKGDRHCYIVFAILLYLDFGHLIHTFQRFGITDGALQNQRLPDLDGLKEELQSYVPDADTLISKFDDARFMFQHVPIDLNMSMVCSDRGRGRWISPYCKRQLINNKGGTAQVWQVSMQDKILSPGLKKRLGRSEFDDPEFGKCYSMALKTFTNENKDVFNRERQNYLAVEGLAGMVQYLGEYEIDEEIRGQGVVHLSKVADAVEAIHNLKAKREHGETVNFHGWHADIKPDNILRVRGEFKLADLGFARFRMKDENGLEPRAGLMGLTETYGAPETDRRRRTRQGGTATDYTQKIDIWSLGCVFSVAATWVVLGRQGVLVYDKLRQNAIMELRESEAHSRPTAADAFHDGQQVLAAVTEWHEHLRDTMRKSDTITSEILDLVDTNMLQQAPQQRLSSRALIDKLRRCVAGAKRSYADQVERKELTPLSDQIKDAVGQVEAEAESLTNSDGEGGAVNPDYKNQTVSDRSLGLLFAHNSHQTTRRNKSELVRRAKKSMRLPRRDLAGTSSHLSSRMGKPDYTAARPACGVPMVELHPDPIPKGPEPPEKGKSKTSQRPKIFINEERYESPDLIPENYPDVRLSNATSLEETSIPELGTPTRTAELPERSNFDAHGVSMIEPTSNQTPPRNVDRPYQMGETYDSYIPTGSPTPPSRSGVTPRTSFRTEIIRPPPSFRVDPNWPICVQLESIKKKNLLERLKGKKNEHLSTFLRDRDIKFVIDNGGSMKPYWLAMRITLEALASMIGKLDKDGLDIDFTIGTSHNTSNASVRKLLQEFDRAQEEALQLRDPSTTGTDMAAILGQIFIEYLNIDNHSKRMTLIIFTDGLWEGTFSTEDVENSIVDFLRNPVMKEKPYNSRWFSIQFVSFGREGIEKLQRLDDELETKHMIE
ncbi:hypothetical protein PG988_005276 [Apiospora saccharicola]